MDSLQQVLHPGGRLYFSVPVGRERVEFNAHRVFAPQTILDAFSALQLISFSVGDDGSLNEDINPTVFPNSNWACSLFEFTNNKVNAPFKYFACPVFLPARGDLTNCANMTAMSSVIQDFQIESPE
jgi:hypothetical protein